ncbi:BTB and MATH domain-containing protein 38 [Hydra vulgaris]|uniref:BTB and MATH domain-containing protein 38 n=1 Tax=Hydra vulgaris TaxID=6087 RepID=A0ABM4CX91_HYDVU
MDFTQPWRGSDLILEIENKPLHVHKNILSIWSPVFDRMFNSSFVEKNTEKLSLPGKKYNEIEEMLHIIYDRRKYVTESTAEFLFSLADEYQMEQLHAVCVAYLKNVPKIGVKVCKYLELAMRYNVDEIKEECLNAVDKLTAVQLDQSLEFQCLNDSIKYTIAKKRTMYLEEQLNNYIKHVDSMLNYLYSSAHQSLELFFTELGLEDSVFNKCDQHEQHRRLRAGLKFDYSCISCRKRVLTSRQFKVTASEISDILESLYKLNIQNSTTN